MDGYAAALASMDAPASVSIRLNPFKPSAAPQDAEPVAWSPYGYVLRERPSFTLDPLFHAGCYYVQDSSAMFVGEVFRRLLRETDRPPRVLDLCAAPGGKSTDLAASLRLSCGDRFQLVANEVMRQRAGILQDNIAVWGDPNVMVTSVDPAAFAALGPYFDIVLVDAPCSGEGMFRKDRRAFEEWSPDVVRLCAARQRRILADVWPALREGGWLLYATCTFEEAENDANLEWAARELGGEILPPADVPAGIRETRSGCLLLPGEVPGEGQWCGALRKTAPAHGRPAADLKVLRPLRDGVPESFAKGRDRIPNPDYALSIGFDRERYPLVEVDRQTALSFLHRDSLVLKDQPAGYLVITFEGHPLGFVKNVGNRCNNLHPQGRRIRMDI